MCFTYKYSYVLTPNTTQQRSLAVNTAAHSPERKYLLARRKHLKTVIVSSEHTANINSFALRGSPACQEKCAALPLVMFAQQQQQQQPACLPACWEAGFPCLFLPYMVIRVVE